MTPRGEAHHGRVSTVARTRAFATVTAVGVALALGACTNGDTTSPQVQVTVTVAPFPTDASATTPAATSAVTPPPPPPEPEPVHIYTYGDEWALAPETEARGSGCSPGGGALPDGAWFGFAHTWSASQFSFDLACWWSGARAHQEGLDDGFEDAYDFYITNDNPTLRTVPVGGNVPARKAGWEDGLFTLTQVIADPGGSLPTNHPYPVWIYINGGEITEIAVQYVP